MPLYEYEDTRTGSKVELFRSVRARDDVPPNLRRVPLPVRLSVAEGIPDPGNVDVATPKAIRDLERTVGTSEAERQMGHKRSTIKNAWNFQSTYRN